MVTAKDIGKCLKKNREKNPMTKKDYIIIAKVLARCRYYEAWCFDNDKDFNSIVASFTTELQNDNERFDYMKFKAFIDNYVELLNLEKAK